MPMFKANINALEKAGIRDKVIVMVGGAPVTQEYADAVGADGYAADASRAVRLAKQLIEQRRRDGAGLMDTVLRARTKTVMIGAGAAVLHHRRAHQPDRAQKLAEELKGGDLSTVVAGTETQVAAGADMLDVNAGIPLVDESELLATMLKTVQETADIPICIDSSVIEALEAGLAVYEGKALVNSVTGEDDRLEEILPLVARHSAAVIGLANDETGIPETPQQRLDIARKIVSAAGDHGIPPEDVVIDPLAMTVGADTEAVTTTLETIRLIRDELGVNMCSAPRTSPSACPTVRAQRRLPADGDGRRAHERDHEHGPGVHVGILSRAGRPRAAAGARQRRRSVR